MESEQHLSPAAALAAAGEARAALTASVSYPRGYVAGSALQAALLMVGATTVAPTIPEPWLRVPIGLAAAASLLLAVINLRRFEQHNGARITGWRFIRTAGVVYTLLLVGLALVVANRANVTDAWWVGFAAAPVAAALTAGYLQYWLRSYRMRNA